MGIISECESFVFAIGLSTSLRRICAIRVRCFICDVVTSALRMLSRTMTFGKTFCKRAHAKFSAKGCLLLELYHKANPP